MQINMRKTCRPIYPYLCSINNQDYEEVIEKLDSITNEEILKVEVKLALEELAHEND